MKRAGLLVLLFAAVPVLAQTNQTTYCCRYPLRVFYESETVNLTPLFQWWKQHASQQPGAGEAEANRPLPGWKRVTGVKAQELEYAWVVNAEVFTSPTIRTNEWIILKDPPAAEEQAYYNLKPLPAQYQQQITNDARAYQAHLKAAQNAETRAQADARSWGWKTRWRANDYNQLAAEERAAAGAARNDERQTQQALDRTQKQLNAIPSVKGRYLVDCFALEIGRNSQGLPIFDLGEIMSTNSL